MNISRKAYQISYTLLRFAQNFPQTNPFREALFALAISLTIEVNRGEGKKAIETLTTLQWMFRLAADSGLVMLEDSEPFIDECYQLSLELDSLPPKETVGRSQQSSLLEYLKEAQKLKGLETERVVSKEQEVKKEFVVKSEKIVDTVGKEDLAKKEKIINPTPSPSTRERQVKIIDVIRQQTSKSEIAVCRLKDLQSAFPDVSERTLRYDLQKLMDEGKVERLGGGPTSAYRLIKLFFPPAVTS